MKCDSQHFSYYFFVKKRKFAIPCIMSLLVSSLYNIVDQIFIGSGVGYLGNGATNVVFPITVIALAIALMIGDGCAAFLSICQGKKDADSTRNGAGNAVLILVLSSIVIMLMFIFAREGILLGISSFLTQLSIVIAMGVMNNVLVTYGAMSKYGADIPMTLVGIVMKVFQIVIAFTIGIAAGSQPIVGYNYGAGQYGRVKEIYKIMMIVEVCIELLATVCFEVFPLQILGYFCNH